MAFHPETPFPIRVPLWLWTSLIFELRRRGKGARESGAFLLGPQDSTHRHRVTRYICYDDLDVSAYQSGAIVFHAAGYAALWQHCREKRLQILADVHTHPANYIRQSPTDQRNPMIPTCGHIAIILPNFGYTPWWSLKAAAIYEYLGDFKWREHDTAQEPRRVILCFW